MTERITDGALRCIGRWGVAKTTIDDIAREAGCSRATIYRAFPGGKSSVLLATGEAEVRRLLDGLAAFLDATDSLEQLIVVAVVESVRALRAHVALQYLIAHEPGQVLAHLSFDALDPLLTVATEFGAPYLEHYLAPDEARRAAEWVTRLVISYGIEPSRLDAGDPAEVTRFVDTFVLPGLTTQPPRGTAAPTARGTAA
jgi:AcrR family transcriptional regulator